MRASQTSFCDIVQVHDCINHYGPTETHVVASYAFVVQDESDWPACSDWPSDLEHAGLCFGRRA